MSRMSRTRSAAAGVAAPENHNDSLLNDPTSNAATAAKKRHISLTQQAAMQQQPPLLPADGKLAHLKSQPPLAHQHSADENALGSTEPVEPSALMPTQSRSRQQLTGNQASRTRSLPPKPKTRPIKPTATTAVQTAVPAEHAEPAEEAARLSEKPLAATLAGLARDLSSSRSTRGAAADHSVSKQIDVDFDFSNDSDDSEFQPEPEQAEEDEEEVIDLSQEDPLDVVQQADGLLSIRSPSQAGAAAAAEAAAEASAADDDDDEFQQLAGKRKQASEATTKGDHFLNSLYIWCRYIRS